MKLKLDTSHISEVEHQIRPPMHAAITLPIDGLPGYAVYVAASPFALGDRPYSEIEMRLKAIASNLSINYEIP